MKPTDGSLDPTLTPHEVSAHGDTLTDTDSDAKQTEDTKARPSATGYKLGELLGRGGMGEVVLADDLRIGRQVAVKRMRSASPTAEATARFLREAKIQARLDHPAIVPVHELGYDDEQRPYFTMKRLSGTTLGEVLATGRESQQKLLRVVVDVCQAIEFAHARGVIHRDLKPANIMLGEYGEVYVLDWGVARVVGDKETGTSAGIESLDGDTQVGAVLGTPGFMSPEQVRGETITPATDVYALGSILYEILAGEPTHPRGGNQALIATLTGDLISPARRAPARTIAPELDDACTKALAFEAADRPTAGELADRIQRYLDGDRDLERRRTLAAEQLAIARAAVASGEPARRAEAMQAAGRALALDPASDAASLVSQLMIEPPPTLPVELQERLTEIDEAVIAKQSGLGMRAMLTYLSIIPFALWLGVNDWRVLVVGYSMLAINMASAWLTSMRRRKISLVTTVFLNAASLMVFGRMFGPFVFVPGLLIGVCVAVITLPPLLARPWIVIGTFLAAFYTPILLELAGVWESTWAVVNNQLIVSSPVVDLAPVPVAMTLVLGATSMMIVAPMLVRTLAVMNREARRHIEVQAWHLEQLLPKRG
jgi:eukaryotic-like serine/threonine-protein kinase